MVKVLTTLLALSSPLSASDPTFVSDKRLGQVDKDYDKCIETKEQNACAQIFYDKQEKLLNLVYIELKQKLAGERVKRLVESQRDWVTYKDKEFELIDSIYPLRGTMFNPMRTYRKGRVLLRRNEELIFYENLLSEFAGDYEGE